jgi:hypothetical protein
MNIQKDLVKEKREKEEAFKKYKSEFLNENSKFTYEKKAKIDLEREEMKRDRINFFPFTHGDEIEKSRANQRIVMREDL